MEIQSTNNTTTNSIPKTSSVSSSANSDSSFASELKSAKNTNENVSKKNDNVKESKVTEEKKSNKKVDNAIGDLKDTIDKFNIKQKIQENEEMIHNNNTNFQGLTKQFNLDMSFGANMNFKNDGQSFSSLINQQNQDNKLELDKNEESNVLATMEMANRDMLLSNENSGIIVSNEKGIKKVNSKTNLTIETILSYDNVIMDKADVEFFAKLVEKGSVDITEVQHAEKSSRVSKTLADLLAKSMNENRPIRIDFDNDISIIIKVSRQGKISADFLPSSQIAEAYLRENLPLLKQRLDDKNIEYDELNQRKQKQDTQDNNRKKGSKNE